MFSYWDQLDMKSMSGSPSQRDCKPSMAEPTHIDTNEFHPTQMLADMLTIREHLGTLKGIKFVYMGDARYNMGNS